MDSFKISFILENNTNTRKIFQGVRAADQIPRVVGRKPSLFVVNTDTALGEGEHWVVFYFSRNQPAEFFDSVGHSPDFYRTNFRNLLISEGCRGQFMYNTMPLQAQNTSSCGEFCLYFSFYRALNYSFEEIVSTFTSNRLTNEGLVSSFMKRYVV